MHKPPVVRLLILWSIAACFGARAAEGMWTLDNLPAARMQEQYGFTPDAAWTGHVMQASLRLAGGCSGSFISPAGLVMTNHHCAASCVAQLSTAGRDLARDGFLAAGRDNEIRCPEVELNRLEQISDVTEQVKKATRGLEGERYTLAQNAVVADLTAACVGSAEATTRCDVVDLYHGGLFHLYRYHRFSDVRLAWVPELAIAFFGGDPDNFNFPRYDLDIALLRAWEDGKPAAVRDFFPFSRRDAAAGELTLVTGHPGDTDRQLTVAQLETTRDARLVPALLRLAELRGLLTEYGRRDAEAARIAQELLFGVENAFKASQGELQALQDPALLRQKQADESALRAFVKADPALASTTDGAWAAIEAAQVRYRNLAARNDAVNQLRRLSRHLSLAQTLVRGADERAKPNAERLPEFVDSKRPETEQRLFSKAPIYPDFEKVKLAWALTKLREALGADDVFVKQVLGAESPAQLASRLVDGTTLGAENVRRALWTGGTPAVAASKDPFIAFARLIDPAARALRKQLETEVQAVEGKNAELIAQARFARLGTSVYPDATFTLRLSYGEVKGWEEKGAPVAPFTTLAGAFERHTGAEPFALPASWLAARGRLDGTRPMNFVTTNDIIGGNSGSPVINRQAEIVGLIFDGNIHSLGGSFAFQERDNRAVAVSSGAIVEALRKVYRADALADEIVGR